MKFIPTGKKNLYDGRTNNDNHARTHTVIRKYMYTRIVLQQLVKATEHRKKAHLNLFLIVWPQNAR